MPTITEGDQPKEIRYNVEGTGGMWTEQFDARSVKLMHTMGLIDFSHVTSSAEWETHFFVKNLDN